MLIGYVTLDEAEIYISEHYMLSDELRKIWDELDDEDKVVLLRKSFQLIEMLPFVGRKTNCGQLNAFPRYPSGTVPDAVKYAQIEQALTSSDVSTEEESKQYQKMWAWGVASYSIGNLSESLSEGGYGATGAAATGITSAIATRLLAPYLQGGFKIV